jgi:hypothetical protein
VKLEGKDGGALYFEGATVRSRALEPGAGREPGINFRQLARSVLHWLVSGVRRLVMSSAVLKSDVEQTLQFYSFVFLEGSSVDPSFYYLPHCF